jgi:hypothetical protein
VDNATCTPAAAELSVAPVEVLVMGTLVSCKCRFSLVESRLRIARVDFYQYLTLLHLLIVLNADLGDVSLDSSADLDQIPVDLGIIRAFVIGGMPPVQRNTDQHQNDGSDNKKAFP